MKKSILKKRKDNKGITGVDATIAVTILMIFVPLITSLISNTYNAKEKINRKVTAVNIAIQAMESVKQMGYKVKVEVKHKKTDQDDKKIVYVTVTYSQNVGDIEITLQTEINKQ